MGLRGDGKEVGGAEVARRGGSEAGRRAVARSAHDAAAKQHRAGGKVAAGLRTGSGFPGFLGSVMPVSSP